MNSPDLKTLQPGDEITVRLKVSEVLPGDIPLFNTGGASGHGGDAQRPYWVAAEQIVAHHPREEA